VTAGRGTDYDRHDERLQERKGTGYLDDCPIKASASQVSLHLFAVFASLRGLRENTVIHLAFSWLRRLPHQGIRSTGFSRRTQRDAKTAKTTNQAIVLHLFALLASLRGLRENTVIHLAFSWLRRLPYQGIRSTGFSRRTQRDAKTAKTI
jgi:hypothetical protein